LTPVLDTLAHL